MHQVEEELLFPQVKEYAQATEELVKEYTEEIIEYSYTIYLSGSDEPKTGTLEAKSYFDANCKLMYFLKFILKIIRPRILGDERYHSFVVYELED